jgi:hypothetical protein
VHTAVHTATTVTTLIFSGCFLAVYGFAFGSLTASIPERVTFDMLAATDLSGAKEMEEFVCLHHAEEISSGAYNFAIRAYVLAEGAHEEVTRRTERQARIRRIIDPRQWFRKSPTAAVTLP